MSASSGPRQSPLLPSATLGYSEKMGTANGATPQLDNQGVPSLCGMPLKYLSLIVLAVQNATLSIVMHYSRVSTPPELAYSPASAVLFNEILKGTISFCMAISNAAGQIRDTSSTRQSKSSPFDFSLYGAAIKEVWREIFSPDCWKLSIPAILYVIQNSLQFVAISNLPVASFQVAYQMKIMTTAAFSVLLLRKKLSGTKWLALFLLAGGVGIVQIQTSVGPGDNMNGHIMNPLKGFGAVTASCVTSGLAGVYFEMVLKNSKADLWVRNVQLSAFSLVPALLPILYAPPPPDSRGFFLDLFKHFGGWAWATVGIQVMGGLITAIVIKYSDNIMKGFATSLSIVLSFLASVVLFNFNITLSFVVGASIVLGATWMYNKPGPKESSGFSGIIGAPGHSKNTSGSPMLGQMQMTPILNGGVGVANGKPHHESSYSSSPYSSTPISRSSSPRRSNTNGLKS